MELAVPCRNGGSLLHPSLRRHRMCRPIRISCQYRVNIVSNSTLAANLGVVSQTVKNGYVLFTVTNRNSQMVSYYTINYQLKDSAGNVLETGSVWGHAINAGSIQYQADYVTREKAALVDIAKSTISITVDQTLSYKI